MSAQSEFLFSDFSTPPSPRKKSPSAASVPPSSPRKTPARKAANSSRKTDPPRQTTNTDPPIPATEPQLHVLSITQLTRLIKLALNQNLPDKIVLQGEISNFKHHPSGHLYLTLKDDNSQIAAVMWKTAAERLKFRPADGLAVIATGRVDVYEPQGKYQFYIDQLEPAGLGALELAFRQLAEKLRSEGLFDVSHKKPIPPFPATIAMVTSATGAALQDITKTLHQRFPVVRKLLYPVSVQGDSAAREIADAIAQLNRRRAELGGIDVMIVGRGGGSIEDLWAFNEEIVARAIFASAIPVISAVGHETDTTIADFVADLRAHTPTDAAEKAVPDSWEVLQTLAQAQQRLSLALKRLGQAARTRLAALASRPILTRPLDRVRHQQQFLDEQSATLSHRITERLHRTARALDRQTTTLRQIEPHAALANARTRLAEQNHRLRSALHRFRQTQNHRLETLTVTLHAASPRRRLEQHRTQTAYLAAGLHRAQRQLTRQTHQQLDACRRRLVNLDPRAVLRRGYSITRRQTDQRIVTNQTPLAADDLITTELAEQVFLESKIIAPPTQKPHNNPPEND